MVTLNAAPTPPRVGDLLWWRGHRFQLTGFEELWSAEEKKVILDANFHRGREVSKYVQSKRSLRCHARELQWASKEDWGRLVMDEVVATIRQIRNVEFSKALMAAAEDVKLRYADFGRPGWFLPGTLVPRLESLPGVGPLVLSLKKEGDA